MAYKQKYQGVPALLKALTGGQKDMVSKMRQQGKGAAADKIEKGIEAAPKMDPTGGKKKTKAELEKAAEKAKARKKARGMVSEQDKAKMEAEKKKKNKLAISQRLQGEVARGERRAPKMGAPRSYGKRK